MYSGICKTRWYCCSTVGSLVRIHAQGSSVCAKLLWVSTDFSWYELVGHKGYPVPPIDAYLAFLVAAILPIVFLAFWPVFFNSAGSLVHQCVFSIIMKKLETCYLKFLWVCLLSTSRSAATRVFSWQRSFYPSAEELQCVFTNSSEVALNYLKKRLY